MYGMKDEKNQWQYSCIHIVLACSCIEILKTPDKFGGTVLKQNEFHFGWFFEC